MGDPTYPLIPVLGFLAFLVTTIPFAYISPAEHPGTFLFMTWEAIDCLTLVINRVVWNGTSANIAPIWCDIYTRLEIGKSIGIPASLFCMIHGTYCRVNLNIALNSPRWKRRYLCMTVAIGLGLPIVAIVLQTVVAYGRFAILEDCGCKDMTLNTWITYLFLDSWPLIFSLLTCYYCVRTILICKMLTSDRLFSHDSTRNRHLFLRTLLCVGSLVVLAVPFCTYNLVSRVLFGEVPYPGWAALRKDHNVIEEVPRITWAAGDKEIVYIDVVESLCLAFFFFSVFGSGEVARSFYMKMYQRGVLLFRTWQDEPSVSPPTSQKKPAPSNTIATSCEWDPGPRVTATRRWDIESPENLHDAADSRTPMDSKPPIITSVTGDTFYETV